MAIAVTPNMGSASEVGSPLWWLLVLENRLRQRQEMMLKHDRYYRGEHELPFLTHAHKDKIQKEFLRLLQESKANFARLVVDTTVERLSAEGFRLSASSDATSDRESWDIWQANCMDAQSQTAFVEALVKGVSYLSVWSDEDGDGYADIAVEDPLETIVAYDGGSNYRRRLAGLKVWLDDINSVRRANVYLPEGIYKFQAPSDTTPIQQPSVLQKVEVPWAALESEPAFVRNPLGDVVPIVPLRNHPRLLLEGESELQDVVPIQNQINGFLFLLALAGYFGAHRQRWIAGIKFSTDERGQPQEPFDIAIDKLLATENPDTKFGEFGQTDLSGYISAIEQKVLHIAVTTRTPRHYLIEQGQSPSGDAIKSAESGLVQKVRQKQLVFGEGLEEAIRLARRFQNLDSPDEAPVDSELVWADPQSQTLGVLVDATVKQYLAGLVPLPIALERMGLTQIEITKILAMKQSNPELFSSAAADPALISSAEHSDVLRNLPKGGS